MANDLEIRKVNDHELTIHLGANSKVTKPTVTPEELYEELGKYLQRKKSAAASPDGCTINYA